MSINLGDGLLDHMVSTYPLDVIGAQVRAARALLGWDRSDLARASEVSERSILRFEAGTAVPRRATVAAIERAFAAVGVTFFDDGPEGFGVRLKR